MANKSLTPEETTQFKQLFSKFCRGEMNAGKCDDDSCESCPVNRAYTEIFASILLTTLFLGDDDE